MAENVASITPVGLFKSESADSLSVPRPQQPPQTEVAKVVERSEANKYRLTIETAEDGRFVYTVSDPITGKVVLKLPRDVVQNLAKDPDYKGGNLLKTSI
ncbi:hypothetical protein GCM10017620_08810 [Brevundimonas intermedia]|uniref:Flagellar protein FlaG n=1 Tax=Brevundimonas intermedia TaxID=74315 RepID=A0ABQ5T968_9CAUL|nr:hypothetical protein [Brevundimonas intermedia]GLK47908.1 hypothetical protein GCM10017620_08810 [Brevundimonas intermedia]